MMETAEPNLDINSKKQWLEEGLKASMESKRTLVDSMREKTKSCTEKLPQRN